MKKYLVVPFLASIQFVSAGSIKGIYNCMSMNSSQAEIVIIDKDRKGSKFCSTDYSWSETVQFDMRRNSYQATKSKDGVTAEISARLKRNLMTVNIVAKLGEETMETSTQLYEYAPETEMLTTKFVLNGELENAGVCVKATEEVDLSVLSNSAKEVLEFNEQEIPDRELTESEIIEVMLSECRETDMLAELDDVQ